MGVDVLVGVGGRGPCVVWVVGVSVWRGWV